MKIFSNLKTLLNPVKVIKGIVRMVMIRMGLIILIIMILMIIARMEVIKSKMEIIL